MNKFIVDALRKKYEYQIALSKANIKNYNDGETPASFSLSVPVRI